MEEEESKPKNGMMAWIEHVKKVAAEKAARTDPDGASHAGHRPSLLPGTVRSRRAGDRGKRPELHRPGARFEFFAMVEAAGVEPASESTVP